MKQETQPLPSYDFAENDWEFAPFSRPKRPNERQYANHFVECIGITSDDPNLTVRINEFVAVAHLSAWWFNGRMQAVFKTRWIWFAVSLITLLGILTAAYLGPGYLGGNSGDLSQVIAVTGANITLLLTGVILVFRTINSWMASYADISAYWKGRSDLLDLIYTLETQFRGKDFTDAEVKQRFETALDTKIDEARALTKNAMETIIASWQAPQVDLDALSVAQASASSFFTSLVNPGLSAREDRLIAAATDRAEQQTKAALPYEITALEEAIQTGEHRLLQLINLVENPDFPEGVSDTPEARAHLVETYNAERVTRIEQLARWRKELADKQLQLASP